MPANLTPQYREAEEAFRKAATIEEKMAALEQMLAVIPKHKGTEKLQADIKRRLAKLRDQSEKKGGPAADDPFLVPKEGAGQVVLVGSPNVGKSALVGALTRARVTVADYPFATPLPVAGMMPYEDVMIQLVDTPPVTREFIPPGLLQTVRNADALLLVVDAGSDDCLEQLETVVSHLIQRRALKSSPGQPGGVPAERCLTAATKVDLPGAAQRLELLREAQLAGMALAAVSTKTGAGLEDLKRRLFELLDVIRVYSKVPGKPPDMEVPFVLPRGSTVVDMAAAVHRDFPDRLRNARVWGSARFDGQAVPRDHVLADRDIVELHV